MLKVTIELTDSKAPPQVYYLSKGDVTVDRGTAETLNPFGGPPKEVFTGAIKITAEGFLANRRSKIAPDCNFFKLIGQRVKDAFLAAATYDRELTYLNMIIGKAKNRRSEMRDDVKMAAITIAKSIPNWREAFEQVLAAGGKTTGFDYCKFCILLGANMVSAPGKCKPCPLAALEWDEEDDVPCKGVFDNSMDNSERRTICRYVLEVGGDIIDYDEARLFIGTALTILGKNDAREKFLGKAEPKFAPGRDVFGYVCPRNFPEVKTPDLNYFIHKTSENGLPAIAAFRNKETRDRVLEFLNKG